MSGHFISFVRHPPQPKNTRRNLHNTYTSSSSSSSSLSRCWPCKSYTAKELAEYGGNTLLLYLSDPTRVDFGETVFRSTARKIPVWITPNTLTRCGLFFNTMICVLSLCIRPAIEGSIVFGSAIACHHLACILCLIMSVLQILVCALDNFDGLHARGTHQCSDFGAWLDHYFDSISIAMNSVAMTLLFYSKSWVFMIGVICGPMIFNMQLLSHYYLQQAPLVIGPEAQFGCAAAQLITAVLFYMQYHSIVVYVSFVAGFLSAVVLLKYMVQFVPMFMRHEQHNVILAQLSVFWTCYALICMLFWCEWISALELCACGVWISWDFNGQIVTHDVLKQRLPILKPYYVVIAVGVAIEEYYGLQSISVFMRNDLHWTTLVFLGVLMTGKNVMHQNKMKKLIEKNTIQ